MIQAVWSKLLPAGWTFHKRNSSQSCEPNPLAKVGYAAATRKQQGKNFFHKKQRCRLKVGDSVTRKKAGGRRRTEAFTHTHRGFYTEKPLHRGVVTHNKPVMMQRIKNE